MQDKLTTEPSKIILLKSTITYHENGKYFELDINGTCTEIIPDEWRKCTLQLIALAMETGDFAQYPEIAAFIRQMDTLFYMIEDNAKQIVATNDLKKRQLNTPQHAA